MNLAGGISWHPIDELVAGSAALPTPRNPRKWDEVMSSIPGAPPLSLQYASDTIKGVLDWIMDNNDGAIEGRLRAEIAMQKEVFEGRYDDYELFFWSFEERFGPKEFEGLLAEAVVAAGRPWRRGHIDIAKAVFDKIQERGKEPFSPEELRQTLAWASRVATPEAT